jgi:hypothetical protein
MTPSCGDLFCRLFREPFYLRQGQVPRNVGKVANVNTTRMEITTHSYILSMEAAGSSETFVRFYQTVRRRHTPEYRNLNIHRRQNPRSNTVFTLKMGAMDSSERLIHFHQITK